MESPIVANGDFSRSCAKVREPIVCSGELVGPSIGVLDKGPSTVHVPQWEGEVLWVILHIGLSGVFQVYYNNRNVFDSCMK